MAGFSTSPNVRRTGCCWMTAPTTTRVYRSLSRSSSRVMTSSQPKPRPSVLSRLRKMVPSGERLSKCTRYAGAP